jgi:hypothetical protein
LEIQASGEAELAQRPVESEVCLPENTVFPLFLSKFLNICGHPRDGFGIADLKSGPPATHAQWQSARAPVHATKPTLSMKPECRVAKAIHRIGSRGGWLSRSK